MDSNVKGVLAFIIVAAVVLAAFGYVFSIMTVGTIAPVQTTKTTETASTVVTPIAPESVSLTQDELKDLAFLNVYNSAGVINSMTTMISTHNYSSAEGTRLTGIIVSAPAPGSVEMKALRSAVLDVLSTLDGSSASGSRFVEAAPKVSAAWDAVVAAHEKTHPQKQKGDFSLSGSGDSVEKLVITNSGGFIIAGEHTGDSNFIVHITTVNGQVIEYVFSEIGDYEGRKIVTLKEGNYYVEVQADGEWTIDISPS